MNNEIWKPVKGYEGLYEVSNRGRIRSMPRVGTKGGLLKPRPRNGYLAVDLNKNGTKKTCDVHRVVATAFIDNNSQLPLINHIDEDKTNNRADNLEWCSASHNVRYGDGIARMVATKEPRSRQFVCEETGKTYKSVKACADDIGVSRSHISNVLHKRKESAKGFHLSFLI